MELSTLISHSAELLRIINKSPKASDSIVSEYFRSKKYIGSKERRFISETIFFAFRNLTLFNHCYNFSKNKIPIENSMEISNSKEFGALVSGILLQDKFKLDINLNIEKLYKNLPIFSSLSLTDELKKGVYKHFNLQENQVDVFFHEITNVFNELENNIAELVKEPGINEKLLILLETRYSIRKWIILDLQKYVSHNNIIKLLDSMAQSAPFIIRVNLSAIDRTNLITMLKSQSIESSECKVSPCGVILSKRGPIDQSVIYKTGLIEIQDEGSQLISYALLPNENKSILDACAGAGGKSLHLATLTNDNSEITALDIDSRKLNELTKRARRFGFKSINTFWVNPKKFKDSIITNKLIINKKFDYVLVDAPCSGTGTIRRAPMHKYNLTPGLLERLQENQLRLLKYYSQFVKNGGILVYATCSIMPQENQDVIVNFLKEKIDFVPSPLKDIFNKSGIQIDGLNDDAFFINLLPSVHGTDGFFIARMKRIG